MQHRGVELALDWHAGQGFSVGAAPACSGLYAQIHWPDRAVRIGQSANIRGRVREATAWARAMQAGTARPEQLRRTSPICERVKATGPDGFEWFLVSDDARLVDEELRRDCEAHLFGWFANESRRGGWADWNGEAVRREFRPTYEAALAAFA